MTKLATATICTIALLIVIMAGNVSAQGLTDYPYPFTTPGGPVEFNSSILRQSGVNIAITVNVYDGTTVVWDIGNNTMLPVFPEQEIDEVYAIMGRRLPVNPDLTMLYAESDFAADGSWYDGEFGVLYDAQGNPRTSFTPLMVAAVSGFADVQNFGLIGGHTDIGLIRRLYIDEGGQQVEQVGFNSHYTIHRVPQDTPDQSVLLREPDLIRANSIDNPNRGPLSFPTLNRSSGCVNYDATTWIALKTAVSPYIESGQIVIVIFSVPGLDQDLLLGDERSSYMGADPFSNVNVRTWADGVIDRRGYYVPQMYR